VDSPIRLAVILSALGQIACHYPVVLPMHPRTARNIRQCRLDSQLRPIHVLGPVHYLDFLCLMDRASLVITDSEGTNRLFDGDLNEIVDIALEAIVEERCPCRPALWDGRAAERIAQIALEWSARYSPGADAALGRLGPVAR
jgi:UDP-N-acetylglucosamine 2-epimerase (non-hydrolysing)